MEKNSKTPDQLQKEAIERQQMIRKYELNMEIGELKKEKKQYEIMSRKIKQLIEKLTVVTDWTRQTNNYLIMAYKSKTADKKKKKINNVESDIKTTISLLQNNISEVEKKILNLDYSITIREYEISHISI